MENTASDSSDTSPYVRLVILTLRSLSMALGISQAYVSSVAATLGVTV